MNGLQVTLPDPAESCNLFFARTADLLRRGIERLERDGQMQTEVLQYVANDVMATLTSPSARAQFDHALGMLDAQTRTSLAGEMHYVASNIGAANAEPADDAASAHGVKTVKESLEKFLKRMLPGPLKKVLHTLNELLSLVFRV